jgi:hypothetical protein
MLDNAFFQFILDVFLGPLFVVAGIAILFVSFLVVRRAVSRMLTQKSSQG